MHTRCDWLCQDISAGDCLVRRLLSITLLLSSASPVFGTASALKPQVAWTCDLRCDAAILARCDAMDMLYFSRCAQQSRFECEQQTQNDRPKRQLKHAHRCWMEPCVTAWSDRHAR